MPRVKKAAEASKPPPNFIELGQAVALADLAEASGMTVEGVSTIPDRMKGAGLPDALPHHVARLAHRIFRDKIDGMLYRCNRPLREQPLLVETVIEAAEIVAAAEDAPAHKPPSMQRPDKKEKPKPVVTIIRRVAVAARQKDDGAMDF